MSLHDSVLRLGAATESRVTALWGRWQSGELSEEQFRALARAVLVQAGAQSAALADLALSAALLALSRRVEAPSGVGPTHGEIEARKAVDETLGSDAYVRDPAGAVAVLGSAFAYEAFQDTYQSGMRDSGVTYWQRIPEPGACEVCEDLSEGVVSSDVPMWHHKGCRCIPRPLQIN